MTEAKKSGEGILRLTIVLFLVSAITALVLGLVNHVTADRIEAINSENKASAMQEVLPADEYLPVKYEGDDKNVADIYQAVSGDTLGYVVQVTSSGFGGDVEMMVGVDFNGSVTGISIISHSETSGLGAVAASNTSAGESFRGQFAGQSGELAVTKDGGTIDALTGATVTSRAVTAGVNAAVAAAGELLPVDTVK